MALVHLVRFGRATLCANLATYSYFMVYGLTLPPAKLTVVFMGNTMLPEWDFRREVQKFRNRGSTPTPPQSP
eukprot:2985697-Amphidinium_carterae.1